MTILDLLTKYQITRKELSEKFGIPYRTVQNWCLGINKCPEYVTNMMIKILDMEKEA